MTDRTNIFEQFRLDGRTVLLTGGSRGIGKALAFALSEAGAEVMIAARGKDDLAAAQSEIESVTGRRPHVACVDLLDRKSTAELVENALDVLGHVDILIPNAGTEKSEPVEAISDDALDSVIAVNLASTVRLTRALVPQMKERGWGRIIYLASVAAHVASTDGHSVYSATKAAIEAFARVAAIELGPFGITANAIAPGVFYTDMAKNNLDQLDPEIAEATYRVYADMTAFGRWGEPSELEGAALLLASNAGSYITGTVLHVDAGLSFKTRPTP